MTVETLLQIHPELKGVLKNVLPPKPDDLLYSEGITLLDLLPEALEKDPGVDSDDAEMLLRLLEWVEHSMFILYVDSIQWVTIKAEVISKNKFLNNLFQKDKLRRSTIQNIHNYLQICPSLICIDEKIYKQWNFELKKIAPSDTLAKKLREENPANEFIGNPSHYDMYDTEAKVSYVMKISKLLHDALKVYIEKYHPSLPIGGKTEQ